MTYLAITQGTTEWLLGKPAIVDALHGILLDGSQPFAQLGDAEFVDGPVRLSYSASASVVAFWNADYIAGTGDETWGFVKIGGSFGLNTRVDISAEVLERCLYVINQRLQGLKIDGAFIHRAHANGAHTCLAGRGSVARHVSIGYFENDVNTQDGPAHSLICVGPHFEFSTLAKAAESEAKGLARLMKIANEMTAPNRLRQVATQGALPSLRNALRGYARIEPVGEYANVQFATNSQTFESNAAYRSLGLTYNEWVADGSPLSELQRRIIQSNSISRHPLRIVGPGGSGKTLLMQLLALRQLVSARQDGRALRVLYVAHNAAMVEKVRQRFAVLLQGDEGLEGVDRVLDVMTLAEYGLKSLSLSPTSVIDPDAEDAKAFQLEQVAEAFEAAIRSNASFVAESALLRAASSSAELQSVFNRIVMAEISSAIKGHGLEQDRRRYVQSERALSRLHGLMKEGERNVIFDTFERYHRSVFEELEVFDSDDIALSLLGKLRTPIWQLQRKSLGYDYVFVDETQLFNENERRVLPLLTNNLTDHVPIVLALDEAQDVYVQSSAGLATLGIPDIASESLGSIHRSTQSIVRLAFFVIQRSTDLFGPDFPDFTTIAEKMETDTHPLASPPIMEFVDANQRSLGSHVASRIAELRRSNLRQVAVICHADAYWDFLLDELRSATLPLQVLTQRGAKLSPDQPLVVLSKPAYIGGQEFDAVILVGLERGLVPPRIADNDALNAALEQQSLRELYLSITRARYRVLVVLNTASSPTPVLDQAQQAGRIAVRA